jgi:hypothetical protein
VANSTELKPSYEKLALTTITLSLADWSKEYLAPALAIFLSTVITKYRQFAVKQIFFI